MTTLFYFQSFCQKCDESKLPGKYFFIFHSAHKQTYLPDYGYFQPTNLRLFLDVSLSLISKQKFWLYIRSLNIFSLIGYIFSNTRSDSTQCSLNAISVMKVLLLVNSSACLMGIAYLSPIRSYSVMLVAFIPYY